MQFSVVINQILTLFLMIFVGYIIDRKGIINEKINQGLSELLVDVTLPALIISSMMLKINSKLITNIKIISLLPIIIYFCIIIFVTFFTKSLSISNQRKTAFKFLLVFSNVGYMGYPVLNAIYPEYGIFYGVIANISYNILMWTYGVYIFVKDKSIEEQLQLKQVLNNGVIATGIGFILLITGYQLPLPIAGALESIGNMTFPLSMLILGSSLTNIKFKRIFSNKYVYLLSGLRLLLIPSLIFLTLKQFGLPTIINNVIIVLFAMPAAANSVIFAEKFDGDREFASQGVFLTTLLSLFTIPLFIYLITL